MLRALSLCLLAAACILAACAPSPTAAPTPIPTVAPTRAVAPTALPTATASPTAAPAVVTPISAPSPITAPSPAVGTPTFSGPGAAVPPEASALVQEAVADAAKQLGVPAAQVAVVSVQMVEWSDASLGCPEPGMAYAEMVTPGYLIKLSAGGKTFEYHADRQDTVVTCASPQPPMSVAK